MKNPFKDEEKEYYKEKLSNKNKYKSKYPHFWDECLFGLLQVSRYLCCRLNRVINHIVQFKRLLHRLGHPSLYTE